MKLRTPDSLLRWLQHSRWQANIALLFALTLSCYLPLNQLLQNFLQWQQMETEFVAKQPELHHQQQIFASLKQRSEQALLTPELANQLLPINQQIQQLEQTGLRLQNSQWEFHQTPLLNLELHSNFANLQHFLTALLQQNQQISLLNLHIQQHFDEQTGFSISSQLQFKLTPSAPRPIFPEP